jgi:hypothetical protein
MRPNQEEPIVIGGCARSGTTLMLAVLSCHPHVYAIDKETRAFCTKIVADQISTEETTMMRIDKIEAHLASRSVSASCRRWCEKTPGNIMVVRRILAHFNERVKIINMVRDGRDVVTSIHPANPNEAWVSRERWVWNVSVGIGIETHPCVMTVRYEDLVLDFEATVKKVSAFISEPDHELFLSFPEGCSLKHFENLPDFEQNIRRPLSASSIGRWQAPEHSEAVRALLETPGAIDCLRHHGYSLEGCNLR